MWLMASILFGVRPISKTVSGSICKCLARGNPLTALLSRIKIPSCDFPIPISLSEHNIPSEISPLILPFLILNPSSSSEG